MIDYQVGKGKPPSAHRFSTENQPLKRGRKPKRDMNEAAILRRVANEIVTVTENGRPKRMTRAEAMVRTLRAKALQGDADAAAELLRLRVDGELLELEPRRYYLSEHQLNA